MDESTLADHIALRQPPDLTFADQTHCLIPFNRSQRAFQGPKPEACRNALFNETVVLLDDVVQIERWAASTMRAYIPVNFNSSIVRA
jgi:hypothetical protein